MEAGPDTLVLTVCICETGDTAQARRLVDELNAQLPGATLTQDYWRPAIRAEIELQADDSPRAIERLHTAESYELANTPMPMIPGRHPVSLGSLATYSALGDNEEARNYFGPSAWPVASLRSASAKTYGLAAEPSNR
jgi:hypothetical protein